MTKKEQRDPNYCSRHPQYGAKKRPKPGCVRCLDKYNRFHGFAAQPTNPVTAPFGKRKVNHFAFVIDRSGSMASLTRAAIKALRANLETIRQEALRTGQESRVTVISFDSSIDVLVYDQPVDYVLRNLNDRDFAARGSTALFDATGTAIERLQQLLTGQDDVAYLVMAITDGEENASQRYHAGTLKQLMSQVQATDRWTLTFLLPPGAKYRFVQNFGIPEGNVNEWEGTVRGVETYSAQNSVGLSSYYAGRTLGVNSTKAFYTDMSKVTTKQVKATLDDIRDEVKIWKVESEAKIRDFCEKKSGKPFLKGAAFYALTKEEKKVQPYKQILIVEKGKSSVYSGPDARSLLGLPDNQTVKLIPGNHANYDIYIQSTSTNRVVVRGTNVVYYPSVGTRYKEGPSAAPSYAKTRR